MELTEKDFFNALGVEPKEEHEQPTETEPQEPAEQTAEQVEDDQTQGAPASEAEDLEDEGQGTEAPEETPATEQGSLTQEQRRANAARRRQAEQQQKIEAAVAQARQEEQQKADAALKDFFQSAGMTNTLTGKPITSRQEFEEFQAAFQQDRLKKAVEDGNVTQEMIDQLVENNPKVRQASALLQQQEAQKAQEAAFQQQVAQELASIHAIDPSISSLEDIKNSPLRKDFEKAVQGGKSFLTSFVAARDAQAARAGQNQALAQQRNSAGKSHLRSPGGTGGAGNQAVPSDVREYFRAINPKATEAQITAYYNKHRK